MESVEHARPWFRQDASPLGSLKCVRYPSRNEGASELLEGACPYLIIAVKLPSRIAGDATTILCGGWKPKSKIKYEDGDPQIYKWQLLRECTEDHHYTRAKQEN
eukprot:scaffold614_cov378-Pavlova_lutheri.AAC.14